MSPTRALRRGTTARWTILGAVLLTAAVCFVPIGATSAGESDGDEVEDTRAVLEKWVEIRRIISKERRDWRLGKEMLTDRIEMIGSKIESLKKTLAETEQSIAAADETSAVLTARNDRLEEAASDLRRIVTSLEARTLELLKRLPEPIRERVKPLSQGIPDEPDDDSLSLSKRFQNIVGILNEVNKFNGEISMTSEVRKLGNGTTAEVTAVYVGIGQAFYASADGRSAGIGTASEDGWTWRPVNDAADAMARAIAILKNEEVAEFVPLPVRID